MVDDREQLRSNAATFKTPTTFAEAALLASRKTLECENMLSLTSELYQKHLDLGMNKLVVDSTIAKKCLDTASSCSLVSELSNRPFTAS